MGRYASLPASSGALDLTDYLLPSRERVAVARGSRSERSLRVTDDWPDIVPINEQELRIIEGHLGDVLDKLLGPRS